MQDQKWVYFKIKFSTVIKIYSNNPNDLLGKQTIRKNKASLYQIFVNGALLVFNTHYVNAYLSKIAYSDVYCKVLNCLNQSSCDPLFFKLKIQHFS